MLSMQGRNAVIFGVANKRSIAWGIAQRLSEAGARLAITYQDERRKEDAQELIAALPGAEGFQCDVSNDAEIERLFTETKKAFDRLDILVNNAGVYEFSPLENVTTEHFHKQFDLNVLGLLLATQEAAKPKEPAPTPTTAEAHHSDEPVARDHSA